MTKTVFPTVAHYIANRAINYRSRQKPIIFAHLDTVGRRPIRGLNS